ncbi:MAG: hypothetical protein IPL35_12410 [Sphingobacteriales bacterium]|nr:hypothetical protein [Sphingobacteriales bacterium]
MWKLFSAKSKVVLSFGKPMDLFGNDVDEAGNSIDRNGKEVEIKEYFMSNGQIAEDNQRDSEYTKILADKIVERFYKENRVLTSHLLAFAIFEILKKRHRRLDLFGLLRLSEEDTLIPYEQFIKVMERLVAKLKIMADEKKLKLSHPFNENIEYIVQHGIENIGIYHRKK